MTQPGSINNIVPRGDDWMVRELHDLKARLGRLETANVGNSMTIDGAPGLRITGGGSEVIDGGGSLAVVDPSTATAIVYVGQLGFNDGSGRSQGGLVFKRADGSQALSLSDSGVAPGHAFQQNLAWRDKNSHIIVAEDGNGNGLANPYIPAGVFADITGPTNTTTSAAFVAMAWADVFQQHPRVQAAVLCQTPAGTAGQIRMTVGGVQVGPSVTVPSASFTVFFIGPSAWTSFSYLAEIIVQLEARVSSGAGAIGVRGMGLWGLQS